MVENITKEETTKIKAILEKKEPSLEESLFLSSFLLKQNRILINSFLKISYQITWGKEINGEKETINRVESILYDGILNHVKSLDEIVPKK